MSETPEQPAATEKPKLHPFRRAVLRGLGILMPPLLTIVLFIWAWNTIENYVLVPIETVARYVIVWNVRNVYPVYEQPPAGARVRQQDGQHMFQHQGRVYIALPKRNQWIPEVIFREVEDRPDLFPAYQPPPATAKAYYHQYVRIVWLPRSRVIPIFLVLFVGILYLLGKFLAAGVGRMFLNLFEGLIHRLPIIRNVYSSVKQVTDFIFSEQEIEYTRVVAVEYPRKGLWSVGFVTGESMLDISSAANEPVLSVLMPTSPMPVTGFTISVRKSEAVDLNITIDQAIQFVVSCGVVVPPHQQPPSKRLSIDIPAVIEQAVANQEVDSKNGNGEPDESSGQPAASAEETD